MLSILSSLTTGFTPEKIRARGPAHSVAGLTRRAAEFPFLVFERPKAKPWATSLGLPKCNDDYKGKGNRDCKRERGPSTRVEEHPRAPSSPIGAA